MIVAEPIPFAQRIESCSYGGNADLIGISVCAQIGISDPLSNPDLTISNPFIRELFHVAATDRNELL
jgi:hypothetical protein